MPYFEKRGDNYRIVFHLGGKRYRHALKTGDESVARSVVGGVERTIMLIEQRALHMPEGADVVNFILSGGQVAKSPAVESVPEATKAAPITLEKLRDKYVETVGARTAWIMPDLATCAECRHELFDPSNRRYRYPFLTCTLCGPRFSIIERLPYDRPNTTMRRFGLCADCSREYADPRNRRFHAQPIACQKCGPHLELWDGVGTIVVDGDAALSECAQAIRQGGHHRPQRSWRLSVAGRRAQ